MRKSKLKILHVEDLAADRDLVRHALKKSGLSFDMHFATGRSQFEKELAGDPFDIILCDHSLPSFNSAEALRLVRELPYRVGFILITATVSEEFAIEMMREGIDDYILKDRLQRLPAAVMRLMEKIELEKEKENYFDEIVAQEKKFRAMIENINEIVALADKDLSIFYRSPAAYRIFGYSAAEFDKNNFITRIHPDDRSAVHKATEQLLSHPGSSIRLRFRSRHKNGHYLWLEGGAKNLLNDESVGAILINIQDITEQKNAEEVVTRNEEHYRTLINSITDAILLVNEKGQVLYSSPSVRGITGMEAEGLHLRTIFGLVHPDDLRDTRKLFKKSLRQSHELLQGNLRIRNTEGRYVWVEGTISNQLHKQGVKGIIFNFRDITRRKKAEELLRKSEATLLTIVNNTELAYVMLNRQFKVVAFNERARKGYHDEFKISLEEGAYFFDYLPGERRTETKGRYMRVLSGEKLRYETSFRQPDKTFTWYALNVFPVFDARKSILGLIVATENITARKNEELEKEKLTADIMQHNKNLEQFAYIVSHNLRSPVANILGLAYLMSNSPAMPAEDLQKCLAGLSTSVSKLDEVIIDLNHILQKRAQVSEKKEPVRFATLADDISALISPAQGASNIVLKTSFNSVPEIYSVKSYLHSIFFNLITNSIKYGRPGVTPVISISTRKKGDKILITFRDNGLGIDMKAYGDKLFGLYKKFHPQIEGKGMGLYIVKTQVELLGGTISAKSTPGKGTTFMAELPC